MEYTYIVLHMRTVFYVVLLGALVVSHSRFRYRLLDITDLEMVKEIGIAVLIGS